MALEAKQEKWLYLFTGGAVKLSKPPAPGDKDGLADMLRIARAKEYSEEQALKTVLLTKAFAVIDARAEEIREALDLKVEMKANPEDDSPEEVDERGEKIAKKSKKPQNLRDPKGRQERAFDSSEAPNLAKTPKGLSTTRKVDGVIAEDDEISEEEDDEGNVKPRKPKETRTIDFAKESKLSAMNAYKIVVDESDKLAAEMTKRSDIDKKEPKIIQKSEPLFKDDEIMDELYTPLVRQIIVPETIIQPKYSATQKMIEGSNDYYLKECQSKGKKVSLGAAAFGKAAVTLGATVATTVISALAPVSSGQQSLDHSGALSKEMAARASDITNGIAAALTGTIDAIDMIDDFKESGDFNVAGYKAVLNAVALSIGRIVAGGTDNQDLGLVITDSLSAAINASAIVPEIVKWKKNGGEPPVAAIIANVGGMIAAGLSAASDETDGTTSTDIARASVSVSAVFDSLAKAAEKKLIKAFKEGDWATVFDVLAQAATKAGAALPVAIKFADQYNAIEGTDTSPEYNQQATLIKAMTDVSSNVEKGGDSAGDLGQEAMQKIAEKLGIKLPPTPTGKALAEINKKFAAKQKELEEQNAEDAKKELASIEDTLAEEKKEYQKSLVCLGSKNPSDAEFKSIAKLVEQLERDRKIWDGLNALFGAGIGAASGVTSTISAIASEVAAPLKIAGQLLKYIANLKSAADRLDAWLTWKDGQKDAESAVSPYASSIDNFAKNQGTQFTHYTLQAAANAIQALLAAGEMSPYAPAFKVAGAGVAMAAAAEDLAYKFYKQVALKRAWNNTKEAFDPKNRGNRKMALLVRKINPTLAKYTLAYGALIEESPIAITAMNRIGIDRETLARAGDGVADLKGYLEKLYPDDGTAIGVMDYQATETKVPDVALTSKAWALSHLLWSEKDGLVTANPPAIVANLALTEKLLAKKRDDLEEEEWDQMMVLLGKLENAFLSFEPKTDSSAPLPTVKKVAEAYSDLVWATAKAVKMDYDTRPTANP